MGKKIELNEFEKRIKKIHPFSNIEVMEYSGIKKFCKYKCLNCGKIHELKSADGIFSRLNPCSCKKEFFSREKKIRYFESLQQDYQVIKIQKDKTWVKHLACGNTAERTTVSVMATLDSCPFCDTRFSKQTSSKEQVEKKLKEFFNGEDYTVLDYKSYGTPCKIKHSCGFVYQGTLAAFLNSRGCPRCFRKISKGEQKISSILKKENINFISQKSLDLDDDKKRYKFDFFLPGFNLAIEYNGEQHYKEKCGFFDGLEKTKKRDDIKKEYCKNHNIDLFIIPYWELNNIETILISKLNDYRKHKRVE